MVDSALPNKKTHKELERELRVLLNKKREINNNINQMIRTQNMLK